MLSREGLTADIQTIRTVSTVRRPRVAFSRPARRCYDLSFSAEKAPSPPRTTVLGERINMSEEKKKNFGPHLRERRLAKGFSLRKFAELLDVSPTYLSHVEQEKTETLPTAKFAKRAAELLGDNTDELIALAGRVPDDLPMIIRSEPEAMPELLRAAEGLTAEDLRTLAEQAKRMRAENKQ